MNFVNTGNHALKRDLNHVDIRWFGAVENNAEKDTKALEDAIETGLNVFIPEGTFLISRPIVLKDKQRIFGEGTFKSFLRSDIQSGVFITWSGTSHRGGLSNIGIISNYKQSTGTETIPVGTTGIYAQNCKRDNMFRDLYVQGFDIGIDIESNSWNVNFYNVAMYNNRLAIYNKGNAIHFYGLTIEAKAGDSARAVVLGSDTKKASGFSIFGGCIEQIHGINDNLHSDVNLKCGGILIVNANNTHIDGMYFEDNAYPNIFVKGNITSLLLTNVNNAGRLLYSSPTAQIFNLKIENLYLRGAMNPLLQLEGGGVFDIEGISGDGLQVSSHVMVNYFHLPSVTNKSLTLKTPTSTILSNTSDVYLNKEVFNGTTKVYSRVGTTNTGLFRTSITFADNI